MMNKLQDVLDNLHFPDQGLNILWQEVKDSCERGEAKWVLRKIIEIDKLARDREGRQQRSFYAIFKTYIYAELKEPEKSITAATKALENYRIYESSRYHNEAVTYWCLGLLLLQTGETFLAYKKLNKATELFQLVADLCETSEYDTKNYYLKLSTAVLSNLGQWEREKNPADNNTIHQQDKELVFEIDGLLSFPWLPIFTSVRAGLDGPEWDSQLKPDYLESPFVFFNDHPYTLKPLKSGGKRVTLQRGRDYGWARVRGQSMNNARPVSINEDDYVLFENARGPSRRMPEENDIVIIASIGGGEGYQYIVKRYWKTENLAISDTSQTGTEYAPIKLGERNQILGIVIAVAKKSRSPVNFGSDDAQSTNTPDKQPPQNTSRQEEFYTQLVRKLGGDEFLAQRMIARELIRAPGITNVEAIQRALSCLNHNGS